MNRYIYSLILSLSFHLLLILFLIRVAVFDKNRKTPFQLVMQKKVPISIVEPISNISEIKPTPMEALPPKEIAISNRVLPDSTSTEKQLTQSVAPPAFRITQKVQRDQLFHNASNSDKSQKKNLDSLFQSFTTQSTLRKPNNSSPGLDYYLNRDIGLRASSIPPPEHKEKVHKTDYQYVPSVSQCRILTLLDSLIETDQTDLYLRFNQKNSITMESFLTEIDQLYKKGFVKRKKISPQQLFSFFGVPIETSAKNRRNPVYSFHIQVDPSIVKRYLESQLDKLSQKKIFSTSDSIQIRELQKKLIILR